MSKLGMVFWKILKIVDSFKSNIAVVIRVERLRKDEKTGHWTHYYFTIHAIAIYLGGINALVTRPTGYMHAGIVRPTFVIIVELAYT